MNLDSGSKHIILKNNSAQQIILGFHKQPTEIKIEGTTEDGRFIIFSYFDTFLNKTVCDMLTPNALRGKIETAERILGDITTKREGGLL